jgi:hypothetical protein
MRQTCIGCTHSSFGIGQRGSCKHPGAARRRIRPDDTCQAYTPMDESLLQVAVAVRAVHASNGIGGGIFRELVEHLQQLPPPHAHPDH